MIKKPLLYFLCLVLLLSVFACKKKTPTQPEVPELILPVIDYFDANPESIKWGESSTLSWNVKNATNIVIDHGIGTVNATGTTIVNPEETITYTLTATNNDGQVQKNRTLEVIARAIFELVSYAYDYTSYGNCRITGTIKNVGNMTGYDVMIEFQAYNANDVIIDTAYGFPADLGNIPVGVSAFFDAIFFNLYDWAVIAKVTYEITWTDGYGMRLTQTGVVFRK